MDRRSYSAMPLVIVDGNGTVRPDGLNNLPRRRVHRGSGRKRPGTRARYLHTRAGRHRPDCRRLSTVRARHRWFQPCAIQLFADAERARSAVAARLASAGRKHESLHRRTRSPPGIRAAGRTGITYFGLRRSDTGGRVTGPSRPTTTTTPSESTWLDCSRRLVEAGNRRTEQEVDLWRALVGLEGSVARWTWEFALRGAKSEATVSREASSRCRAWSPLWVHPGWMTPAASCAARPIPQPGACRRPASFPAACRSMFSAGRGASRRSSWST